MMLSKIVFGVYGECAMLYVRQLSNSFLGVIVVSQSLGKSIVSIFWAFFSSMEILSSHIAYIMFCIVIINYEKKV